MRDQDFIGLFNIEGYELKELTKREMREHLQEEKIRKALISNIEKRITLLEKARKKEK